ncbi:MAG TPA: type 1 glutamine amidotransferase [Candidatus Binatia bacterium]
MGQTNLRLGNSCSVIRSNGCARTGEVLVFQHDPFEELGSFAEVLNEQRTSYEVVRLFHGEAPSDDWQEIRAFIILGGSLSDDEEMYPFLRWEKKIIRAAVEEAVPILSIGFGAELLASVLGAHTCHRPIKEIGWCPISLSSCGQADPCLGYLSETATVFQWYGGGFDLPAGAVRLASSTSYDNQAFRIGKNIYGLQFHLEVTPHIIEHWTRERSKDPTVVPYLSPTKILEGIQPYAPLIRFYADRFLSEFLLRAARNKPVHKAIPRRFERAVRQS